MMKNDGDGVWLRMFPGGFLDVHCMGSKLVVLGVWRIV